MTDAELREMAERELADLKCRYSSLHDEYKEVTALLAKDLEQQSVATQAAEMRLAGLEKKLANLIGINEVQASLILAYSKTLK